MSDTGIIAADACCWNSPRTVCDKGVKPPRVDDPDLCYMVRAISGSLPEGGVVAGAMPAATCRPNSARELGYRPERGRRRMDASRYRASHRRRRETDVLRAQSSPIEFVLALKAIWQL